MINLLPDSQYYINKWSIPGGEVLLKSIDFKGKKLLNIHFTNNCLVFLRRYNNCDPNLAVKKFKTKYLINGNFFDTSSSNCTDRLMIIRIPIRMYETNYQIIDAINDSLKNDIICLFDLVIDEKTSKIVINQNSFLLYDSFYISFIEKVIIGGERFFEIEQNNLISQYPILPIKFQHIRNENDMVDELTLNDDEEEFCYTTNLLELRRNKTSKLHAFYIDKLLWENIGIEPIATFEGQSLDFSNKSEDVIVYGTHIMDICLSSSLLTKIKINLDKNVDILLHETKLDITIDLMGLDSCKLIKNEYWNFIKEVPKKSILVSGKLFKVTNVESFVLDGDNLLMKAVIINNQTKNIPLIGKIVLTDTYTNSNYANISTFFYEIIISLVDGEFITKINDKRLGIEGLNSSCYCGAGNQGLIIFSQELDVNILWEENKFIVDNLNYESLKSEDGKIFIIANPSYLIVIDVTQINGNFKYMKVCDEEVKLNQLFKSEEQKHYLIGDNGVFLMSLVVDKNEWVKINIPTQENLVCGMENNGKLIVCTNNGKVFIYNNGEWKFSLLRKDLLLNHITCIGNYIVITGDNGYLFYMESDIWREVQIGTSNLLQFESYLNSSIFCLLSSTALYWSFDLEEFFSSLSQRGRINDSAGDSEESPNTLINASPKISGSLKQIPIDEEGIPVKMFYNNILLVIGSNGLCIYTFNFHDWARVPLKIEQKLNFKDVINVNGKWLIINDKLSILLNQRKIKAPYEEIDLGSSLKVTCINTMFDGTIVRLNNGVFEKCLLFPYFFKEVEIIPNSNGKFDVFRLNGKDYLVFYLTVYSKCYLKIGSNQNDESMIVNIPNYYYKIDKLCFSPSIGAYVYSDRYLYVSPDFINWMEYSFEPTGNYLIDMNLTIISIESDPLNGGIKGLISLIGLNQVLSFNLPSFNGVIGSVITNFFGFNSNIRIKNLLYGDNVAYGYNSGFYHYDGEWKLIINKPLALPDNIGDLNWIKTSLYGQMTIIYNDKFYRANNDTINLVGGKNNGSIVGVITCKDLMVDGLNSEDEKICILHPKGLTIYTQTSNSNEPHEFAFNYDNYVPPAAPMEDCTDIDNILYLESPEFINNPPYIRSNINYIQETTFLTPGFWSQGEFRYGWNLYHLDNSVMLGDGNTIFWHIEGLSRKFIQYAIDSKELNIKYSSYIPTGYYLNWNKEELLIPEHPSTYFYIMGGRSLMLNASSTYLIDTGIDKDVIYKIKSNTWAEKICDNTDYFVNLSTRKYSKKYTNINTDINVVGREFEIDGKTYNLKYVDVMKVQEHEFDIDITHVWVGSHYVLGKCMYVIGMAGNVVKPYISTDYGKTWTLENLYAGQKAIKKFVGMPYNAVSPYYAGKQFFLVRVELDNTTTFKYYGIGQWNYPLVCKAFVFNTDDEYTYFIQVIENEGSNKLELYKIKPWDELVKVCELNTTIMPEDLTVGGGELLVVCSNSTIFRGIKSKGYVLTSFAHNLRRTGEDFTKVTFLAGRFYMFSLNNETNYGSIYISYFDTANWVLSFTTNIRFTNISYNGKIFTISGISTAYGYLFKIHSFDGWSFVPTDCVDYSNSNNSTVHMTEEAGMENYILLSVNRKIKLYKISYESSLSEYNVNHRIKKYKNYYYNYTPDVISQFTHKWLDDPVLNIKTYDLIPNFKSLIFPGDDKLTFLSTNGLDVYDSNYTLEDFNSLSPISSEVEARLFAYSSHLKAILIYASQNWLLIAGHDETHKVMKFKQINNGTIYNLMCTYNNHCFLITNYGMILDIDLDTKAIVTDEWIDYFMFDSPTYFGVYGNCLIINMNYYGEDITLEKDLNDDLPVSQGWREVFVSPSDCSYGPYRAFYDNVRNYKGEVLKSPYKYIDFFKIVKKYYIRVNGKLCTSSSMFTSYTINSGTEIFAEHPIVDIKHLLGVTVCWNFEKMAYQRDGEEDWIEIIVDDSYKPLYSKFLSIEEKGLAFTNSTKNILVLDSKDWTLKILNQYQPRIIGIAGNSIITPNSYIIPISYDEFPVENIYKHWTSNPLIINNVLSLIISGLTYIVLLCNNNNILYSLDLLNLVSLPVTARAVDSSGKITILSNEEIDLKCLFQLNSGYLLVGNNTLNEGKVLFKNDIFSDELWNDLNFNFKFKLSICFNFTCSNKEYYVVCGEGVWYATIQSSNINSYINLSEASNDSLTWLELECGEEDIVDYYICPDCFKLLTKSAKILTISYNEPLDELFVKSNTLITSKYQANKITKFGNQFIVVCNSGRVYFGLESSWKELVLDEKYDLNAVLKLQNSIAIVGDGGTLFITEQLGENEWKKIKISAPFFDFKFIIKIGLTYFIIHNYGCIKTESLFGTNNWKVVQPLKKGSTPPYNIKNIKNLNNTIISYGTNKTIQFTDELDEKSPFYTVQSDKELVIFDDDLKYITFDNHKTIILSDKNILYSGADLDFHIYKSNTLTNYNNFASSSLTRNGCISMYVGDSGVAQMITNYNFSQPVNLLKEDTNFNDVIYDQNNGCFLILTSNLNKVLIYNHELDIKDEIVFDSDDLILSFNEISGKLLSSKEYINSGDEEIFVKRFVIASSGQNSIPTSDPYIPVIDIDISKHYVFHSKNDTKFDLENLTMIDYSFNCCSTSDYIFVVGGSALNTSIIPNIKISTLFVSLDGLNWKLDQNVALLGEGSILSVSAYSNKLVCVFGSNLMMVGTIEQNLNIYNILWQRIHVDNSFKLNYVRYIDNSWLICGNNGVLFHSLDTVTWNQISSGRKIKINDIIVTPDYKYLAIGTKSYIGVSSHSLTPGSEFEDITNGGEEYDLNGVVVRDDKFVAAGTSGLIIYTQILNKNYEWKVLNSGDKITNFHSLFYDEKYIYACSEFRLFYTDSISTNKEWLSKDIEMSFESIENDPTNYLIDSSIVKKLLIYSENLLVGITNRRIISAPMNLSGRLEFSCSNPYDYALRNIVFFNNHLIITTSTNEVLYSTAYEKGIINTISLPYLINSFSYLNLTNQYFKAIIDERVQNTRKVISLRKNTVISRIKDENMLSILFVTKHKISLIPYLEPIKSLTISYTTHDNIDSLLNRNYYKGIILKTINSNEESIEINKRIKCLKNIYVFITSEEASYPLYKGEYALAFCRL
jgi:hypothetical protein